MKRILVARWDNIGDLVLTTPLIMALRHKYQNAEIDVAVQYYTREVLGSMPEIDHLWYYKKIKHCEGAVDIFNGVLSKIKLYRLLRKRAYDLLLFVGDGTISRNLYFIRWVSAHNTITFGTSARACSGICCIGSRSDGSVSAVEEIFDIVKPLGIIGYPPKLKLYYDKHLKYKLYFKNKMFFMDNNARKASIVHIHLSARKPSQQWPLDRFAAIIRELVSFRYRIIVTWAPGSVDNIYHPGDNDAIDRLVMLLNKEKCYIGQHWLPVQTFTISELKALLTWTSISICPDGGTMHIVAALGIPIVALFGDSDSSRWRPWRVSYKILQASSREVSDISVSMVKSSFLQLSAQEGLTDDCKD